MASPGVIALYQLTFLRFLRAVAGDPADIQILSGASGERRLPE